MKISNEHAIVQSARLLIRDEATEFAAFCNPRDFHKASIFRGKDVTDVSPQAKREMVRFNVKRYADVVRDMIFSDMPDSGIKLGESNCFSLSRKSSRGYKEETIPSDLDAGPLLVLYIPLVICIRIANGRLLTQGGSIAI